MAERVPAAAIASLLAMPEEQVQALVEAEVLPKPTRDGYDLVGCVRAYAVHMRSKVPADFGWPEARRMHELEGISFTEIARIKGCSVQAVSARAKREDWIDRREIIRETRLQAARLFAMRDVNAVLENLTEKHAISRDLLALVRKQAEELATGKINVRAALAVRHLSVALKNIEHLDANIAGLTDGKWRTEGMGDPAMPVVLEPNDFISLLGPQQKVPVQ